MLVGAEIYGALEAVNALPEVQEALRRRGVEAEDDSASSHDRALLVNLADPTKQRLARFDCFNIRGQEVWPLTDNQRLGETRGRACEVCSLMSRRGSPRA